MTHRSQRKRIAQPQVADEAAPAQAQSANEAASAQAQSTAQDSTVELNWILFDGKSHRVPFEISIPRDLYDKPSQRCRPLFVEPLLEEHEVSVTMPEDVVFWTPKEPLSLDDVMAVGWAASVTDFREHFSPVLPSRSLSRQVKRDNHDAVHLVITVREGGLVKNVLDDAVPQLKEFKLYNKTVLTKGPSPSEGAKLNGYRKIQADKAQVIYDGRWSLDNPSTVAPPIQIFHPIFDDFIHLLNDPDVQPTPDDLEKVQDLMVYAAQVGWMEEGYNEGLHRHLRGILGYDIHRETNSDGTSANGVIALQVGGARIASLILVLKRELGEDGCDPSLQAGLSMRRSWIDPSKKAIRDKCCCPTFLVAGGGPWFSVMGGVFTDKVIVQPLTDMRWNALSSSQEDSRIYHNARIFASLRQCLAKLHDYYGSLKAPDFVANEPHPRYFPYPTSFTAKDGSLTRMRYLTSLEENDACVTYLAEVVGVGVARDRLVVKFVARYGKEVHEFLAEHGYAPVLRYYGPLPDTKLSGIPPGPAQGFQPGLLSLRSDLMHMVVMDYIDAQPNAPPDARAQIEEILTLLHSEGYVFGDLRNQNILFDARSAKGRVKLIDFNWCGRYDMTIRDEGLPDGLQDKIDVNVNVDVKVRRDGPYVCYPLSTSTVGGMWVDGMGPLNAIRPRHDWGMFVNRLSL